MINFFFIVATISFAWPAFAHTPYLRPNNRIVTKGEAEQQQTRINTVIAQALTPCAADLEKTDCTSKEGEALLECIGKYNQINSKVKLSQACNKAYRVGYFDSYKIKSDFNYLIKKEDSQLALLEDYARRTKDKEDVIFQTFRKVCSSEIATAGCLGKETNADLLICLIDYKNAQFRPDFKSPLDCINEAANRLDPEVFSKSAFPTFVLDKPLSKKNNESKSGSSTGTVTSGK